MGLINKVTEEGLAREDNMENYVSYLVRRPKAERGKRGYALWNGSDKEIDLNQMAREAAEHNGNTWTFVLSLKREDVVRLGCNNGNMWRELVRGRAPEIVRAIGIPVEHLMWYGAFHNEGHHPHIHPMRYSKKPREGYLESKNLMKLKSSFANEIFHGELYYIYKQKDEVGDGLKNYSNRELEQTMTAEYTDHPRVEALLWELFQKLKTARCKKVYGRLEKENKMLVDEIIREISKDKKISQACESWSGLKDDILSTYQSQERTRRTLAEEPELRNVKNMVLKSALILSEMNEVIITEPEERNHEIVSPREDWQGRTKEYHQMQTQKRFLLLMKYISHIIEEDYDRREQQIRVDRKLIHKIMEKKETHGQKM